MIFTSLIRVQLIESEFHLLMDAGQFVLKNFSLLLDFLPLQEYLIELSFQLIILVLDVLVGHLYIFWSGIDSEFIQGQIIVGQLSLKISDFGSEAFESLFKFVIKLLFFVDGLCLCSELLCLLLDIHHLLFYFGDIVVSIVYFSLCCYSLWAVDTTTGRQWTLLHLDCGTDTA